MRAVNKMKTIAQETAPQRALRNCSKETGAGEGQDRHDFGEEGVRAIKNIFFFFCRKFLLVTGSRCHHEGI